MPKYRLKNALMEISAKVQFVMKETREPIKPNVSVLIIRGIFDSESELL